MLVKREVGAITIERDPHGNVTISQHGGRSADNILRVDKADIRDLVNALLSIYIQDEGDLPPRSAAEQADMKRSP